MSEYWQQLTACVHSETQLRYKQAVNGTRFYHQQCLRCGASAGKVRTAEIPSARRPLIPPFDEAFKQQWIDARLTELRSHQDAERQEEQERWFAWYSSYLQSPEWHETRRLVLNRAKDVCEGCASASATQVHHLTYVRAGDELLFDLVAVCKACHQKAHPDKQIGADD